MHDILLIHYDNTPLLDKFPSNLKFNPSTDELNNSDIDTFISKQIIPQLQEISFDILCIKDTLSENYIDFYGLILAYHIRLNRDLLKEKSMVPIIILSDINEFMINKLSPFGRLLFTKNIFLCKNNVGSVEHLLTMKLALLNEYDYEKLFINLIHINPPQDYLSHHSITNEWAIDQWAYFYGVEDEIVLQNRSKISSMLYYKFLRAKYQLQNKDENLNVKAKKYEGSILLVDDQSNAGWYSIIKEFCKKHYLNVEFDYVRNIKKDSIIKEVFELFESKINQFSPDIILLDLRLLESDDNIVNDKLDINKISGIKLLKRIEQLNPGIQVIMFTASSDGMILDEFYRHNILGYVKKDAPRDKYRASKNNFNKLDTLIKLGLNRKYLKEIWALQEKILKLPFFENQQDNNIKELRENIKTIFETANSNIPRPFTYSMLAMYKCIELLNDIYIIDDYKNARWKYNKSLIDYYEDNSTKNYLFNIIKYRTNLEIIDFEKHVKEIVCSRNYAIHTKIKANCEGLTTTEPSSQNISKYFSDYIMVWFKMLFDILNNIKYIDN